MSNLIPAPHQCLELIENIVVPVENGAQEIRRNLVTPKIFSHFVLRLKTEFNHGGDKASGQKFGGIYNLIKNASILLDSGEAHHKRSAADFYVDSFIREGMERNDLDYNNVPNEFTQNINYNFDGRGTVLGGAIIPDGAFALDLRHTSAGVNTFNSVELVLDIGTVHDVFQEVNDTSLSGLTIEVWGERIYHTDASRQRLGVKNTSYAETVTLHDIRKIDDVTLVNQFLLRPVNDPASAVGLSDVVIMQLDEGGNPIPFTDENAIISVLLGQEGAAYCQAPLWYWRDAQNRFRRQPLPPNMLHITTFQRATALGGISAEMLFNGVVLEVMANNIPNQDGATKLIVQKNYAYKAPAARQG